MLTTTEDELKKEIAELRRIISEACSALGNHSFMAETCSLEFMWHLPEEIRLRVAALEKRPEMRVFAAWGETWFECCQCGVRKFKAALVLPGELGRPCCSNDCVQREREQRAMGRLRTGSKGEFERP